MASEQSRHVVADNAPDSHNGVQLATFRCYCGAERGEDYHKYCYHLAEHDPADFGLGGEQR